MPLPVIAKAAKAAKLIKAARAAATAAGATARAIPVAPAVAPVVARAAQKVAARPPTVVAARPPTVVAARPPTVVAKPITAAARAAQKPDWAVVSRVAPVAPAAARAAQKPDWAVARAGPVLSPADIAQKAAVAAHRAAVAAQTVAPAVAPVVAGAVQAAAPFATTAAPAAKKGLLGKALMGAGAAGTAAVIGTPIVSDLLRREGYGAGPSVPGYGAGPSVPGYGVGPSETNMFPVRQIPGAATTPVIPGMDIFPDDTGTGGVLPGTGQVAPFSLSRDVVTDVTQPALGQGVMPFDLVQARQELEQVFSGFSAQNAALMAQLSGQMIGQLDRMEADLRQQFEQQGNVMDPAMQGALREIREEVARRRQGLLEEMNRRGLLQSGIWLEMEDRILKGQLTAEERLLANRVADLQNRMTDAVEKLRMQQLNVMGELGQNQMEGQRWMQGQQIGAMTNLNNRADQWNRWWQDTLAQQQQAAAAQARFEAELQHRQAVDMAGLTGVIPGSGRPTLEARRHQADAALQRQRALGTRATAEERITTTSKAQDMASVVTALQEARAGGVARDVVISEIEARRANYISRGLDMNLILREVERLWPATPKRNWWGGLNRNYPRGMQEYEN